MSGMETSSEHLPRVTKSCVEESPQESESDYCTIDFVNFDDSDTLLCTMDGLLRISFNNGESWQTVDGFRSAQFVDLDEFHKERAFVLSGDGKVHVTENQGRSWKELHFPKVAGKNLTGYSRVDTHPFDKNLLLLHCDISGYSPSDSFFRNIVYVSQDGGQNFRCITLPNSEHEATLIYAEYRCQFAASSKESTLERNGIYCTREVTCSPSQDSFGFSTQVCTLFYTADLGKSMRGFDELNGFSVQWKFIFPSSVLVLTSEQGNHKRLWVFKGGLFEPVRLPDGAISLEHAAYHHKKDQKLLLLTVRGNDRNDHVVHWVLDPSNLNFSRYNAPRFDGRFAQYGQLGNLYGTLWGRFPIIIKEDVNWLRRILDFSKNLFFKEYTPKTTFQRRAYVTKASFDNGKTWTNLRVVDPSRKLRHLFNCNIEDVEHCSFQEGLQSCCFCRWKEPTPGIIMKVGTVGKYYRGSDRDDMTFISRDGGASWEVAFKVPVFSAFLDFGNIIVAIPKESSKVYTKFLFSLDQGTTWNEYYFDEPITERHNSVSITSDSQGLKAVILFENWKEGSAEYIFYSVDFSNIFGGAGCTEDDLETWYLSNGKCIDGMKYSFKRRKPDAKCLMRKTFERLELHEEKCEC